MNGIKIKDVTLYLGQLPNRKQECFYFAEVNILYPVAYVKKEHLEDAKRLWGKMVGTLPWEEKEQ